MSETVERDGVYVRIFRSGFRPGYYAEATDATGQRVAFTGVFRGPGSKQRAIEAALAEARTGRPAPNDTGALA